MVDTAEVYDDIVKFMHWLAWKNEDDNKALMNHDDIFGELQVEFVKSLQVYGDLPKQQFINVTKRMCDNRVGELKHKYYNTHRGIPGIMGDLDSLFDSNEADDFDLEEFVESRDFVEDVRGMLRGRTLEIFDMIIYGDSRITELVRLSGMRSSYVYRSRGTIRVKPWHIADAMAISIREVMLHLSTIGQAVRSRI